MLSGDLVFICGKSNCGGTLEADSSEFDFDNTWTEEDRGMGSEEGYEALIEKKCPNCGEEYKISYTYTEYPVGALNFEEGPMFDKEVKDVQSTLTVF
ncbi:hypothetical protein FDP56_07510 [Enterococcus casseliflavus]|uniref:hypothetical protein n=1 Tax=Enterococcus casseliflavus TaxID=37734 RepID=UPI00129CE669|nr:hypothetical protein [Enterococcus casseliflavus]MRI70265.1 hypothetical protein [Enterococcus casseliflavus]